MTGRLDEIPSGFETNAGTFRRAKADQPPAGPDAGSKAGFRAFLKARQARSSKEQPSVNLAPQVPIVPTQERLGKEDQPKKTSGGYYRAPAPIERLRNGGKLDPVPRINEAMYTAAQMLQQSFYNSGLSGHIKSQDFTGSGGGMTMPASHMPVNEFAAHHRQKFRTACARLGWYEAFPLRGCGRLVVDVICHECSLEDAGRKFFPGSRKETALASAGDRLKEGLFMLAVHWRLV